MANIGGTFKRFQAIGCSHGHLADPKALETVLKFRESFRPQIRIHLGDFTDQAAFRSGATGTKDETVSIADDLTHGLNFLREFRPTHLLCGNHEIRLWKLADHHNEIVSRAANSVIAEIRGLADKLKAKFIDHYDITRSWIDIGDTRFLHGFMYGENAIRDHAEHFGKCVHAHLHQVGESAGRRSDNARAYCVGTLANIPSMNYALTRRATARWSHGFAYGETNGKETHVWLSQGMANTQGGWRLPL